jgi:hypothetical protein
MRQTKMGVALLPLIYSTYLSRHQITNRISNFTYLLLC